MTSNKGYEKNNIFRKIIDGEIKADIVAKGEHFLAFNDIAPKAPVHVLVVPKGDYIDFADFAARACDAEIADFSRGIAKVVEIMHLNDGGYRLISNSGAYGQQEVMHMHVHILGDRAE